jgi:hypothetical protein
MYKQQSMHVNVKNVNKHVDIYVNVYVQVKHVSQIIRVRLSISIIIITIIGRTARPWLEARCLSRGLARPPLVAGPRLRAVPLRLGLGLDAGPLAAELPALGVWPRVLAFQAFLWLALVVVVISLSAKPVYMPYTEGLDKPSSAEG